MTPKVVFSQKRRIAKAWPDWTVLQSFRWQILTQKLPKYFVTFWAALKNVNLWVKLVWTLLEKFDLLSIPTSGHTKLQLKMFFTKTSQSCDFVQDKGKIKQFAQRIHLSADNWSYSMGNVKADLLSVKRILGSEKIFYFSLNGNVRSKSVAQLSQVTSGRQWTTCWPNVGFCSSRIVRCNPSSSLAPWPDSSRSIVKRKTHSCSGKKIFLFAQNEL